MDQNKFEEIELKMKDLNFGDKLNLCTYRTQGFYMEKIQKKAAYIIGLGLQTTTSQFGM